LCLQPLALGLRLDALRDVADGGGHQQSLLRLERTHADLCRELRAVLTTRRDLHPRPHRARVGLGEVARPMTRMYVALLGGHEDLHGPADELVAAIPEEALDLRVHQDYSPVGTDAEHGV